MPRVDLIGIAPGGNSSLERSVDIDIAEMPGCPEGWRIGARLTPVSAFLNAERQHADLLAETGTDVPIPESDIVLPEAGVYHIDSDVRYALGTATGGSGYIIGWLRDETTDTLLTSFTQIAAISAAGQEQQGGTTHIMTEYTVTSGPRTVRLHLMFVLTGGRITDAEAAWYRQQRGDPDAFPQSQGLGRPEAWTRTRHAISTTSPDQSALLGQGRCSTTSEVDGTSGGRGSRPRAA